MQLCDLFEARAYSLFNALEPFRDDPTVFVTFTDVLKVGLNPKSEWDDPLGIYCYPVSEMWDRYSPENVPFAGDRKYAFIMRATGSMCELQAMEEGQLDADVQRMVKKFSHLFYAPLGSEDHTSLEERKEYFHASLLDWTSRRSDGESLWYTVQRMSSFIENRFPNRDRKVVGSALLRACAYDGVVDRGESIISDNEPAQAVFLSTKAMQILACVPNDLFTPLRPDFEKAPQRR